jgi:flagellar hook-associated protein 3 FlgL
VGGANGIQVQMSRLDNHFDHINIAISDTGQKEIRMDIREAIINDLHFIYTERMSTLEDTDMAKAIIELKEKEMTYQAALTAAGEVMQLSLVDYI